MSRLLLPLALLSVLLACGGAPPAGEEVSPAEPAEAKAAVNPEHAGVDLDDPNSCAACHGTIVQEWQASMHASAHHDKDPIYGAMRSLRMARQGEQVARKCAVCHTPRDTEDDTSAAAQHGVSCATCHHATSIGEGQGAKAITWADGPVLRGPKDLPPGASPVHGTGPAAPHLTDGKTMCLACHDATRTPSDQPACTTGPELAESATDETCVSCHMPAVDTPNGAMDKDGTHRAHIFAGPHRAWYQGDPSILQQAVDLSATLDDGGVHITLANRSGHAFPTGFPGRMALVAATGQDAAGEVVWKAWGADPMTERPDAVLNKVYVDADGKPVMPPFSDKLARDNRLKPDETRTLDWEVPAEVATVDVKLVYRLAPPPAMKALDLMEAPESAPKTIGQVSVSR